MKSKWERRFEIAVPIDTVWQAFTDPEYRRKLFSPPPHAQGDGVARGDPQAGIRVIDAQPKRLLRWVQERPDLPEKAEFTVTFESTERGSRITVTRCGFGEGELADLFSEANALGWLHGIMDLVLFLETGQLVKRHYEGCNQSSTGIAYAETDAGLEVREMAAGSFADEVGLRRGDRLVRIGGAPVYTRSDLWLVNALLAPGSELDVEFVRGRELLRGRGRLSPPTARAVGE